MHQFVFYLLGEEEAIAGTCWAWGDPHYTTFDGLVHHFQGECTYTFASDIEGRSFAVHAHQLKCNGEATCIRGVYVEVPPFSQTVTLWQGGYIYPSNPSKDIFSIQKQGMATTLHLRQLGVTVSYDGSHRLEVMVPEFYKERLGGLCGNFNGNPSDDFQANVNDGLQLTSNLDEFGFSWHNEHYSALQNCTPSVVPTPSCIGKKRDRAVAFCNSVFEQDSFKQCRSKIDSLIFINTCIFDHCIIDDDSKSFSLSVPCASIIKFASQCQDMGIEDISLPNACCELNSWKHTCMKNVIQHLHHHECMDVLSINSLTAPSNLAKKFALRICGRFPYECLLLSSLSM